MISKVLFVTFWFCVLNTYEGLASFNFTLFQTIDSMKYTSLSKIPLDSASQIECALQCDQSQCWAASYHQPLQQCYLHQTCYGDVENATGWNILQPDIVLKTIYINQTKSWDDSQAYCASLGGRLAVIDTAEKQDLIKSWNYATTYAWLGASDRDEEGTWLWYNPTQPVMLDYWSSGQPNNYGGNQDCMTFRRPEFVWDDRVCSDLFEFICDIPEKH